MATPARQLRIEFLYLDLDTCTRCRATDTALRQALEPAQPALEAAGVGITVTKTLVTDERQARAHGFVSSPTILVDGIDIAAQLVESACDTCAEACACGGGIDCRDWIWRGERSTEPPVGLIVEAIMRHAFAPGPVAASPTPPATIEVPENLCRFFASKAVDQLAREVTHCCEATEQDSCCGPMAGPSCCGPAAMVGAECGCRS